MDLNTQSSILFGFIVVLAAVVIAYVEPSCWNTIVNGQVPLVLGGWGVGLTVLHFVINHYAFADKLKN